MYHFILELLKKSIIHYNYNFQKYIIETQFMSFYIRKSCKFMAFTYVIKL